MTKDDIVADKLQRLYDKIYPIARDMGISLNMVEGTKSITTLYVPLIEDESLDPASCASYEVVKELRNHDGVGCALDRWEDRAVEMLRADIAEIIRSHIDNCE